MRYPVPSPDNNFMLRVFLLLRRKKGGGQEEWKTEVANDDNREEVTRDRVVGGDGDACLVTIVSNRSLSPLPPPLQSTAHRGMNSAQTGTFLPGREE